MSVGSRGSRVEFAPGGISAAYPLLDGNLAIESIAQSVVMTKLEEDFSDEPIILGNQADERIILDNQANAWWQDNAQTNVASNHRLD